MKKNLILLLIVGLFSNAQNFNYGLKLGTNLSLPNSENNIKPKQDVGFLVGAIGEYAFNEKFSLQAELSYQKTNSTHEFNKTKIHGGSTKVEEKINITQNYLISQFQLPVLFKYYPIKNLAIEAGPNIGMVITNKLQINQTNNYRYTQGQISTLTVGENTYHYEIDMDDPDSYGKHDFKLNKIQLGLNIGAMYQFDFGLFTQIRYNYALNNLSENSIFRSDKLDPALNNTPLKLSNVQLSLGYFFN